MAQHNDRPDDFHQHYTLGRERLTRLCPQANNMSYKLAMTGIMAAGTRAVTHADLPMHVPCEVAQPCVC